jgi:hypothetical protein
MKSVFAEYPIEVLHGFGGVGSWIHGFGGSGVFGPRVFGKEKIEVELFF